MLITRPYSPAKSNNSNWNNQNRDSVCLPLCRNPSRALVLKVEPSDEWLDSSTVHEWLIIKLAGRGIIAQLEVDTRQFDGTYPESIEVKVRKTGWFLMEIELGQTEKVHPCSRLTSHLMHFEFLFSSTLFLEVNSCNIFTSHSVFLVRLSIFLILISIIPRRKNDCRNWKTTTVPGRFCYLERNYLLILSTLHGRKPKEERTREDGNRHVAVKKSFFRLVWMTLELSRIWRWRCTQTG